MRAWPLVQISHPGVRLEEWLSYAISTGKRLGKTGGVVAIEDARGYIHALFAWNVLAHGNLRRAMRVTDMIVAALPGRRLAETIVEAVRDIAEHTRADSVLIEIGDRQLAPDALLSDGFDISLFTACGSHAAPTGLAEQSTSFHTAASGLCLTTDCARQELA